MHILSKTCFLFISAALIGFVSCKKENTKAQLKSLPGSYSCTVTQSGWSLNQGTLPDTTYSEMLEVTKSGTSIEVKGYSVPVEALKNGQTYTKSNTHDLFELRIHNNEIYAKFVYHSLGAGTTKVYSGHKL